MPSGKQSAVASEDNKGRNMNKGYRNIETFILLNNSPIERNHMAEPGLDINNLELIYLFYFPPSFYLKIKKR
jgi:hypothetical protein